MTKFAEIPSKTHYSLIVRNTKSIFHEGDERSRNFPGHGYPAYTETLDVLEYHAFDTADELVSYLESWKPREYKVALVTPLSIKTTLDVVEA